jgi:hypothetical protein
MRYDLRYAYPRFASRLDTTLISEEKALPVRRLGNAVDSHIH